MLDRLFEEIGAKIKNWAKFGYVIGIIVSLLAGIIFFLANENVSITWVGFLIIFGGTITISAFSTLLYGFGELIDKTCDNESNTRLILEKLTEENYDNDYAPSDEEDENDFVEDAFAEDDEPQEYVPSCTEEELKRKIAHIADLRKKGLISEDLYRKAINNPRVLDKF